ncbi:hypothetical protein ATANTOWER_032684 [Ataeniobius toweri]|uniref:Uncharacterized protein n=1 Tax=Ataeniobius toweri TaxID=208326 RepID=A0ABU7CJ72_9TELE|nr:hypothetical protein [Ataeniobius toweri]
MKINGSQCKVLTKTVKQACVCVCVCVCVCQGSCVCLSRRQGEKKGRVTYRLEGDTGVDFLSCPIPLPQKNVLSHPNPGKLTPTPVPLPFLFSSFSLFVIPLFEGPVMSLFLAVVKAS